MQGKLKAKPKRGMSRRHFLQLGIASAAIGIGAGIAAQWAKSSASPQVAHCSYTWAANTTRVNEASSAILHEALMADGLNPTRSEVYDRAMEYKRCYDADYNLLSDDLLYRNNDSVLVIFTVAESAMNDEMHNSLVQDVLDTFTKIDAFTVQEVDVQITNGEVTVSSSTSYFRPR